MENDQILTLSIYFCDSPCGGYVEEETFLAWRLVNGKFEPMETFSIPFLVNSIVKFKNQEEPFIFFINYNTTYLTQFFYGLDLSLPYSYEAPWEC